MLCYSKTTFESCQAKEYRYNHKYNPCTERGENICDHNNVTTTHDNRYIEVIKINCSITAAIIMIWFRCENLIVQERVEA